MMTVLMKRFISILCSILVWNSCLSPITYETQCDKYVSDPEQQALRTFHRFVDATQTGDFKSIITSKPEVTSVEKMYISTKSSGEVPLYVVSFSSGSERTEGFAIVGEYSLVDEVLAFVPVGSLADTTYNKGLAMFINDLESALTLCHIKTKDAGVSKVGNIFYQPDYQQSIRIQTLTYAEAYSYGSRSPFVQDSTVTYEYLMAEVPTKWGQNAPYSNKALKNDGTVGKIGCVPVAIGQVMAYHRKPETYDWDLILSSPTVALSDLERADSVSTLLYDIATAAGTNFSTGSSRPESKLSALQVLGYSGVYSDYGDKLNSNIPYWKIFSDYTAPILMGGQRDGGGHAWVVDGVLQQCRWYCDVETVYNQDGTSVYYLRTFPVFGYLVHCNWGWSGVDDGWYYNFHTDNLLRNYYYNKNMVSQIQFNSYE